MFLKEIKKGNQRSMYEDIFSILKKFKETKRITIMESFKFCFNEFKISKTQGNISYLVTMSMTFKKSVPKKCKKFTTALALK